MYYGEDWNEFNKNIETSYLIMDLSTEHQEIIVIVEAIVSQIKFFLMASFWFFWARNRRRSVRERGIRKRYSMKARLPKQIKHLRDIISMNDEACINNLRMSRNSFGCLCLILQDVGGLVNTKHVSVSEQVAIFLSIIAHHKKNMIVKHDFKRLGYTISMVFNNVLTALLSVHTLFLANPEPIEEGCRNERWKWFKVINMNHHKISYMVVDPVEIELPEITDPTDDPDVAFIEQVEPSARSSAARDTTKSTRRSWSLHEELVLISALKELVTDSNARTMRHKSWPLYKDWCEVFGKDRQQEKMQKHLRIVSEKKSTGKRKTIDESDHYMQMYMNMIGSFCDRTDSRLGEIVMRVGSEHDAKVSRKAVFEALSQITSLEMEDKIYVAMELVNNTKKLDLFFSMPVDAQIVMVKMMLQGRI
ncbi:hypothetical protein BUALT_Bualt16G0048300 [Buddleja alternifolia]|uniref:DUF8040 domain-containing protein n=1 Tax=Buddleja alternifolia TaxID=168488 RepID=A0AAV6WHI2_9LAMI|nr:hypothetical protein BUALT_Bualt16G0048300 [Buddleja alternifolia]